MIRTVVVHWLVTSLSHQFGSTLITTRCYLLRRTFICRCDYFNALQCFCPDRTCLLIESNYFICPPSWWWLMMLKLDPLSSWQTCSSCMVLRRLLCIMRSSPPCRLCVQWVRRCVIAIIRVCTCLPGVYGLFYAVSIPYHHGQVTPKSFIIHVTPEAMNCPIISAALCIWCSWSDFFFSRYHAVTERFYFASLRWNITWKSK